MTETTHDVIRAAISEVYANLDNSGHYGHRPSTDTLTAKIVARLEMLAVDAEPTHRFGVGDDGA